MSEFARDEDIWIRKYLEAWHMATENGYSALNWAQGSEIDEKRDYLEDKHAVVCRGLGYKECNETPECHEVYVA